MNDRKINRTTRYMEIAAAITAIVVSAAIVFHFADGDWLGGLANVLSLVVVYEFCKLTRNIRLLMHYIEILEAERDYNEKRIKYLDKECHISEEIISDLRHIDANNCEIIEKQKEIISYKNQIIKNYESATSEVVCFIPSEEGGE